MRSRSSGGEPGGTGPGCPGRQIPNAGQTRLSRVPQSTQESDRNKPGPVPPSSSLSTHATGQDDRATRACRPLEPTARLAIRPQRINVTSPMNACQRSGRLCSAPLHGNVILTGPRSHAKSPTTTAGSPTGRQQGGDATAARRRHPKMSILSGEDPLHDLVVKLDSKGYSTVATAALCGRQAAFRSVCEPRLSGSLERRLDHRGSQPVGSVDAGWTVNQFPDRLRVSERQSRRPGNRQVGPLGADHTDGNV